MINQKMTLSGLSRVLLLTVFCTALPALADDASDQTQMEKKFAGMVPDYSAPTEELRQGAPWLFFGVDGGYVDLFQVPSNEGKKRGTQFNFKADASVYRKDWVFDAGLGYFVNRLRPRGAGINVSTNGAVADLSARYRLGERWSIGPVLNILASEDASFQESDTNQNSFAMAGGLRAVYEFPVFGKNWLVARLGFQALTDLTIGTRQLLWLQGTAMIGFPIAEPKPVYVYIPAAKVSESEVNTVIVDLDERMVPFETNKAEVSARSMGRLTALAAYLKENSTNWQRILIEGHTDVRGSIALNTKLSEQRALAVKRALGQNGIQEDRVEAVGYGPARPLDPRSDPVAWAKNRRVTVVLKGVIQKQKFVEDINTIWPENDTDLSE